MKPLVIIQLCSLCLDLRNQVGKFTCPTLKCEEMETFTWKVKQFLNKAHDEFGVALESWTWLQ